jgi:hypothetical protein
MSFNLQASPANKAIAELFSECLPIAAFIDAYRPIFDAWASEEQQEIDQQFSDTDHKIDTITTFDISVNEPHRLIRIETFGSHITELLYCNSILTTGKISVMEEGGYETQLCTMQFLTNGYSLYRQGHQYVVQGDTQKYYARVQLPRLTEDTPLLESEITEWFYKHKHHHDWRPAISENIYIDGMLHSQQKIYIVNGQKVDSFTFQAHQYKYVINALLSPIEDDHTYLELFNALIGEKLMRFESEKELTGYISQVLRELDDDHRDIITSRMLRILTIPDADQPAILETA